MISLFSFPLYCQGPRRARARAVSGVAGVHNVSVRLSRGGWVDSGSPSQCRNRRVAWCVRMVLFVAWAALWVESGLPAPGAAAGGKAMVGNGRPGGSGHPYLNSEVDARGHGGRRVELDYGNFVVQSNLRVLIFRRR